MPAIQRRHSLRLELLAVLSIVLVMAVVSLSWAGQWIAQDRHRAVLQRQLEVHAEGLAALLASTTSPTAPPDRVRVEQILRPSLGALGIQGLTVYRRLEHAPEVHAEIGLPSSWPAPAELSRPRTRIEHGAVVIDTPIRTFGASQGASYALRLIASPLGNLGEGDLGRLLLLAGGVALVLLVIGAALLESQVLRPLTRLREAVEAVEQGDLRTQISNDGPREFEALAAAFNQMTQALEARVSEVEAQRRQLIRAEQLASVGRVAAGMAHEVGNPLAALLGYVDFLLDPRIEPPLNEGHKDLLERCRLQLQRIQNLLSQLLDYSRPSQSQGLRAPACEAVDVDTALARLMHLLRHDPRCEGVEFSASGDPHRRVWADPAWFDQIMQNLLVNAARANRIAPAGPCVPVRITVRGDTETSILEIQDAGAGVPPEVRAQLFEPFVTTAPAGEGTGLGLAICRALVASLRGSIECLPPDARPPLPGQCSPGAVFCVTLPTPDNRSHAPASH